MLKIKQYLFCNRSPTRSQDSPTDLSLPQTSLSYTRKVPLNTCPTTSHHNAYKNNAICTSLLLYSANARPFQTNKLSFFLQEIQYLWVNSCLLLKPCPAHSAITTADDPCTGQVIFMVRKSHRLSQPHDKLPQWLTRGSPIRSTLTHCGRRVVLD